MKRAALAIVGAVIVFAARLSLAQQPEAHITVDAVAVRFHTPDTGGVSAPRFITHRQLAFEARLFALEDDAAAVVQDRHVRAALDAHIAEDMLGALPLEHAPDAQTSARAAEVVRKSLEQRVGGAAAIERAMKLEGIEPRELDAIILRQARALLYADSALGSMLSPNDDQLRETYRTTSHPFRGRRYEDCKDDLERWYVIERYRTALQGYLQTARSRVTIVYF